MIHLQAEPTCVPTTSESDCSLFHLNTSSAPFLDEFDKENSLLACNPSKMVIGCKSCFAVLVLLFAFERNFEHYILKRRTGWKFFSTLKYHQPEISSTANISTDGKILLFTILNGPQLHWVSASNYNRYRGGHASE